MTFLKVIRVSAVVVVAVVVVLKGFVVVAVVVAVDEAKGDAETGAALVKYSL